MEDGGVRVCERVASYVMTSVLGQVASGGVPHGVGSAALLVARQGTCGLLQGNGSPKQIEVA